VCVCVCVCALLTNFRSVCSLSMHFLFVARQPLLGQGILIVEASRSHSVGFLWTSDQPDTKTST